MKRCKQDRKQSRRHGDSGYTKTGSSPPRKKTVKLGAGLVNGVPADWLIDRIDAINNILSLDAVAAFPDKEDEESGVLSTLGSLLESQSCSARETRLGALLPAFAETEKQRVVIEMLCRGYKPKEIQRELRLKSLSSVTDRIYKLRSMRIYGHPLREVLRSLNKGLSVFGDSFNEI